MCPWHPAASCPPACCPRWLGQVPHGSLQDSGMVAAAAYRLLASQLGPRGGTGASGASPPLAAAAAQLPPARLVLLGTNHFTDLPPVCLSTADAWRTPLGDVAVDRPLTRALAGQGIRFDDAPHKRAWLFALRRTRSACCPPALHCSCLSSVGSSAGTQTAGAACSPAAAHPSFATAAWSTRLRTSSASCSTPLPAASL